MKRLLYIVMLLLPMVAYANGDPTAEFCALTLSKTPVPRAIPEIQVERENLHVVLEYGRQVQLLLRIMPLIFCTRF